MGGKMKYRLYFIGIVLILSCSQLFGQVTINSVDYPQTAGSRKTFYVNTADSVVVDAGTPGTNQRWNFSQLSFSTTELVHEYLDMNAYTFTSKFPSPNIMMKEYFPNFF